jgi:site-specific DNA recombinase
LKKISPFSSKIICGDCGAYYGSKVWHSTDKYRRVIWRCNGKYKGDRKCGTYHLYEEDIKKHFLSAVGKLMADRERLIDDCDTMRETLLATTDELDRECETLTEEMDTVSALTKRLIAENASTAMSQDEYNRKYDGLAERFDTAEKRCDALKRRKVTLAFEVDMIECFMTEIRLMPELPTGFNESHWNALVDHVTVYADDRLVFTFKNGSEITENF